MSRQHVLFVCVANAARSQMAEALLRHAAGDRFEAFSAGTAPTEVDPRTLQLLTTMGIPADGLRSKALEEFAGQRFDHAIALRDKSAMECRTLPHSGEVIA